MAGLDTEAAPRLSRAPGPHGPGLSSRLGPYGLMEELGNVQIK
jgi:hypothetical protein